MKIIGKLKRILGMFLKVSAILSLAVLFILRPHLIFPFLKMIAVAGAFIWFLKFIEYDPNQVVKPLFRDEEDEEEESIAEYFWRVEPITPPQIFDQNGHLRR